MKDIVKRRPGYNNEMMLDYCETIHRVICLTKKVNRGRGRSAVMVDVPVHDFPEDIKHRIENSLEYYKNHRSELF